MISFKIKSRFFDLFFYSNIRLFSAIANIALSHLMRTSLLQMSLENCRRPLPTNPEGIVINTLWLNKQSIYIHKFATL
jgi:hypothetical protein